MKKLVLLLPVLTLAIAAASATAKPPSHVYTTAPMTGRHDLVVCMKNWADFGFPTMGYGVLGDGDNFDVFYGGGMPLTDPRFQAPPDAVTNPPGQVRGGQIT